MRLPSSSYDKNELARSLSVAGECPGNVIEADDYLQPASARNSRSIGGASELDSPVSSKVPLLHPYNQSSPHASRDEKHVQVPTQARREKRYAHLEAAAARKQRELEREDPSRGRGNSINSRYSSDPIRSPQGL